MAALLTAFWTVPLVATFGYTANMRYEKLTAYVVVPLRRRVPLGVPAGGASALVLGIVFRDRATIIVASIAVIFALVFRFWPELHAWNLRFLPFWYLGIFLLAAIGAAEIVRRLSGEFGRLWVGPPASPDAVYDADAIGAGRTYRVVTSMTIIVTVVVARGRRHVVQPDPAGLPRLLGGVERDRATRTPRTASIPNYKAGGAQAVPRVPRAASTAWPSCRRAARSGRAAARSTRTARRSR